MSNLYDIDRAILACVDEETGEVIDPEALDSLLMQRTDKIESVVLWIKNLQADVVALKAEKDAFAYREKCASAKIDQLKTWLAHACGGEKFSTAKCAVSFRRSESVEVLDESAVPAQFMVETVTTKPDKTAIKELLKSGHAVNGCRLVEKLNPQIK